MSSRAKRRRKVIPDSGLGVSLRERKEQLSQNEENMESVKKRRVRKSPRKTVNSGEDRNVGPKDDEDKGSSEENIADTLVPKGNVSTIPTTAVNSPQYSIYESPERNSSPVLEHFVPARVSLGNEIAIPHTTEEMVSQPSANRNGLTTATSECEEESNHDGASIESSVSEIIREIDFISDIDDASQGLRKSTKESGPKELEGLMGPTPIDNEQIVCNSPTERSSSPGDTAAYIEALIKDSTQVPAEELNLQSELISNGAIRPPVGSLGYRISTNESAPKELEGGVEPTPIDIEQIDCTPPTERSITPENIVEHRKAVTEDNVSVPAEELNLQSGGSLQCQQLFRPSVQLNSGNSVVQGSVVSSKMNNMNGQNREGNGPVDPSLTSVFSLVHKEYVSNSKLSELGELLDFGPYYVVRAWIRNIRPSIEDSVVNFVKKFCPECHRKCAYNEDINDHLCSRSRSESLYSFKLIYYAEFELCDETVDTLRVALTGEQAVKLFGCKPQEFIKNTRKQKRVWKAFKYLVTGGKKKNWCVKDSADFTLEPHLKGTEINYRVVDISPFGQRFK